jgi:SAM-dependent methyltransferase
MSKTLAENAEEAGLSLDLRARARQTAGASSAVIYAAAVELLREVGAPITRLIDVGCGRASLRAFLGPRCTSYIGVDAILHRGLPEDVELVQLDLDTGRVPLPSASSDVVTCLETIEHVENPRALLRELYRLVRPGGVVLVSTPNQLSVLSKLSLLTRNEFVHFQERPGLYPAHISALLEVDLVRIYREVGLREIVVRYTGSGRVPLSAAEWPRMLSARTGFRGRAFSDNVLVIGQKPTVDIEPGAVERGAIEPGAVDRLRA